MIIHVEFLSESGANKLIEGSHPTKVELPLSYSQAGEPFTVGLFAVIAQHEREIISKWTKDAFAAKKAWGAQLSSSQNFTTVIIAQGTGASSDATQCPRVPS